MDDGNAKGSKPALVVVDVQRAFDAPEWGRRNNPAAEARIAELLEAWRAAAAPIYHIRHTSNGPDGLFQAGSEAHDFKPEAAPRSTEPVIEKRVHSAFIGTDLERRLREAGATGIVVAGLTTDHCCSTTVRMASDLGFETTIVSDATATYDRSAGPGATLPAELIHETALASLRDEFADVLPTVEAIELLR
ncbi:MAG: cysteine hydrolase [Actinomycetota bacterium]|nr:cysteine hydrolase [Actinomycetota bacterium]